MDLQLLSENRCFGGQQQRFSHHSSVLNCTMNFSVFLPPQASVQKVPALFWLSGLTCTDENFVQKAGAQRYAAELGVAIICPDTSPRGEQVPDDSEGAWDFGLGAGFYLNATQQPWVQHYQMERYITTELYSLVLEQFPVQAEKLGIFGHSMGGHGALTLGLKYPLLFRSISAFAPICAPSECPWGEKAFSHYLGKEKSIWQQHDSCWLIKQSNTPRRPLLVDQGTADNFLEQQLQPGKLSTVCEAVDHPLELRMQPGYNHSYFFIASFIGDHLRFHLEQLQH